MERRQWCASGLVLLAAVGCGSADDLPAGSIAPTPIEMSARRLTDWPGTENSPRFSPDGERLAFYATVDGQTDVYILSLGGGEIVRVTDSPSIDRRPAWSPDGTQLAFVSDRSGPSGVWTVTLGDGDPTPVFARDDHTVWAVDWSPKGDLLTMTVNEPDPARPNGHGTPWVVALDGTGARPMTKGGDEWYGRFDATGEWIYYYTGAQDAIEAVHVDTGRVRSYTDEQFVGWRPVPSPRGDAMAFVSSAGGRWSVWVGADPVVGAPVRVSRAGQDDFPSWSPDGRYLAYSSVQGPESLHELDVSTGARRALGIDGTLPQVLADGAIAYLSDAERTWDVRVVDPQGQDTLVPIELPGVYEFQFTPDGSRLAVVSDDGRLGGNYDVYLAAGDGTDVQRAVTHLISESPVWCGDSLTYSSNVGFTMPFRQVWALDQGSGAPQMLTTSSTSKRPTDCSSDGAWLVYRLTAGSSGLYLSNLAAPGSADIEIHPLGFGGRLAPDGQRVAFLASTGGRTDLYLWSRDGSIRQLTDDDAIESAPSWTPDGERLIFSAKTASRDLWIAPAPGRSPR